MTIRTTTDVEVFVREPMTARVVFSSCCFAQLRHGLFSLSLHGNPTLADVDLLHRALSVCLQPSAANSAILVDASLLGCLEPAAFELMSSWLLAHKAELSIGVSRLALVRSHGLTGAIVTGLYHLLEPAGPFRCFVEASAAAEWLDAAQAGELLRSITLESAETDSCLRELRLLLRSHAGALGLSESARKLGVSVRTLQRKLEGVATTFRLEQRRARIECAQTLMLASDASLTRIAIELEFASPQHFSSLFRRHHGCTPSEWRDQRRGHSGLGEG